MKNINYSVGGGVVYQWWIGAFIKYTIDNFYTEDTYYTKTYSKDLKELIDGSFNSVDFFSFEESVLDTNNIDILLEGNGGCFEDINLLYKDDSDKSKVLFFQIKGGNEITIEDGKVKKDKVLAGSNNVTHLFSNFLTNKNIYNTSEDSKFIILTNKYLNTNIVRISKGEDISLIVNQIIGEVRAKFKGKTRIKVNNHCIEKFENFVKSLINGTYTNKRYYGVTLPLENKDIQDEIILFVKNTWAIICRTKILENFKLDVIFRKILKELGEEKMNVLFQRVVKQSIDISSVKRGTPGFNKYLKYTDLYFTKSKKISDLNAIREGKIL